MVPADHGGVIARLAERGDAKKDARGVEPDQAEQKQAA
jgi:hypothetical protein